MGDFTFNPPEWNGAPKFIAEMWRLTKDGRFAHCEMQNHPTRKAEVRCYVDGELHHSLAENDAVALIVESQTWMAAFKAEGWNPAESL